MKVFGFIHKIMGITKPDLIREKKDLKLTQQDLAFLLTLIKRSTFQGEEVELLYNLIIKLQQLYLEEK